MRSIFLSFIGLILLISPAVAGERDNVNDPSERARAQFLRQVLVVSLAIGTMARAEDIAPPPEATAPIFLIKADSKAMADKLSALQLAVQETLRLKDVCGASDLRLCQPEPPCDAQGQRPKPWQGCILAWGTNENDKETLTWVDEWKVDNAKLGYRKPVLGSDGKLY